MTIFIGVLLVFFVWVLWIAFQVADENKKLREELDRERGQL